MYEGRTKAESGIVFGHEKYGSQILLVSLLWLMVLNSMGIVDVSVYLTVDGLFSKL